MKILFLCSKDDIDSTKNLVINFLKNQNIDVTLMYEKINPDIAKLYDFIISYSYRHIIKKDVIDLFQNNNIINLHISYLPYNRGSDPNLWSILDNTPCGVTIHLVDNGLDTGHILCQTKIKLDEDNDTLKSAYNKLKYEIFLLFSRNWNNIKKNNIISIPQNNKIMTKHVLKDRPDFKLLLPNGWDTKIKIVKHIYINNNNNIDNIYYDNKFKINNKIIDSNSPTYFIAELSCNHNQDKSICLKLIDEAHKAGADAIKLQTYTPDTMTIKCDKPIFKDCLNGSIWEGTTLYDLYSKAYTPWEWHKELKDYANNLGMDLFTSPFDPTAVDFLETLNMPAYKIASFEITDHILIKRIAQTGKPVIISSGMASLSELNDAISLLRAHGTTQICMLKCTSAYPARPDDANLITIKHMMDTFNVVGGLSDHTLGIEVSIASVVLGARIIEKHFTLSRESGSADDAFSLLPQEFKQMVDSVRIVEKTIGKITYAGVNNESSSKKFRRSLFVVEDIKKGEKLTDKNVRSIRPSNGLHTRFYDEVIGKKANKVIERGTPLTWNLFH